MATRATYTFTGEVTVHTYIHYDGYPQGAANYFQNMLDVFGKELRGGAAEQFIRANKLAQFTSHWDDHGDTEYHYEVDEFYNLNTFEAEYVIRAYKFNGFSDDRKKHMFFQGTVAEFIKKYKGGEYGVVV
jgi:hypothetical protein